MRVNQQLIGFVGFESVQEKHVWEPENILMLQQFTNILSNAFERSRLLNELEDRAIRDELTGVLNRRGFLEFARVELMRANRFNRPTSIILFDVDQLKHVNDSLGHIVGDEVIQEVVKCSQHDIRQIDLLGRWGGDEFVVLLPETNLDSAVKVAERLCMDIEEHYYTHEGKQLRITVSIGVAANRSPDDTVDDLFSQADVALYEAKESGKNCVKVSRIVDS
jgi:diguanylate cyclase (GGDEF)-like protein